MRWLLSLFVCLFLSIPAIACPAEGLCHEKAGAADSLSSFQQYQAPLAELADYFSHKGMAIGELLQDPRFEIHKEIADRFKKSAEVKSLDIQEYKRILKFEEKIERSVAFTKTHSEQLKKAESQYGIPRYIISAIIGVESDYGKNLGSYNPFNVYASMYAVGYRQQFARAQLKELLEFADRHNLDIFDLKSSYAGAMSFAQFIPYSINKWFVGKDISDLNNNIMSVANYLAYFKKRTGSHEKAVLRYNPSSLYVKAVMALAEETEKHF